MHLPRWLTGTHSPHSPQRGANGTLQNGKAEDVGATTVPASPRKRLAAVMYSAEDGETPRQVAAKLGVPVEDLVSLNRRCT